MKNKEFHAQMTDAYKRYQETISYICRSFALDNNTVAIGDIVCDHIGSVLVTKIKHTSPTSGIPECVYFGKVLTKKLVARADNSHRHVYQHNLIPK